MKPKPVGRITRGTTAPNRLRRIDRWILHYECSRLRTIAEPIVVDLGYGATPITAVELRNRLHQHVSPNVKVVGIEIDPLRVAQAQELSDESLTFIKGGFEVPTEKPVALIRALNVLRQYEESEVVSAWQQMSKNLLPNGLIIDGTCDEIGRRAVWVAIRKLDSGEILPQTLTISTHLASLEKPSDIAPRLPKILIHHNVSGEKIHEVLHQLDKAWAKTSSAQTFGARQHWIAAMDYAKANGLALKDNQSRWRLGEVTLDWSSVS
ncbi:MAG: hypothetical protein RJA41_514 [Actinomycetota bacterium]